MNNAIEIEADLFSQAVDLPDESTRRQFLQEKCGDDVELFDRLCEIVESHFAAHSHCLLDDSTKAHSIVHRNLASCETEGSQIGNYTLLRQIGEGGMGVVFLAEQLRPIRRRVAIKIIRTGMNSEQVLDRFEAEREALSRLEHPNVTRILDAGITDSGRPFFAMELVEGISITEYCDKHRVSVRGRLQLFSQVCSAIHHAHQKGIIHRDVKPKNIMVTLQDGLPTPKVIDFGIAKAVDQPLIEKTLFTRDGDVLGTPEYMSPEQAEMGGRDLDVRSDIFSLGVVLYELLTGTTPLELDRIQDQGLLRIVETIRDFDTEIPSCRLAKRIDVIEKVAHLRQATTGSLPRLIKGELDWIAMKALSKERNMRYESAAAFAKDISRFLEGESVEAAAPSMVYRAKKAVRKHRTACVIAAGMLTLLITATALSTIWAVSNDRLNRIAQQRADALEEKTAELQQAHTKLSQALAGERVAKARANKIARQQKNAAAISKALARHIASKHFFQEFDVHIDDKKVVQHMFDTATLEIRRDRPFNPRAIGNNHVRGVISTQILAPQVTATPTRSLSMLGVILEEQKLAFGDSDPIVADTLVEISKMQLAKGGHKNLQKAEAALGEAIAMLSACDAPEADVMRARIYLGKALLLNDEKQQAEAKFSEVRKWMMTQPQPMSDKVHKQMTTLLATAEKTVPEKE